MVAEVESHWDSPCASCGTPLIGHDLVIGLLLREEHPRCAACLAERHGKTAPAFLAHAHALVRGLDCFRAGWEYADRRLADGGAWPEARHPQALRLDLAGAQDAPEAESSAWRPEPGPEPPSMPPVAATLDAGDMGCGELVLLLRARMNSLSAGERLHLTARDPGAPEDLPAWCRMTGHRLCLADPPVYVVERRPD